MSAEDIIQIKVSGRPVGILGFKAVLKELSSSAAELPDERLAGELLTRISIKNYIPAAAKTDYGKALVREFRRQLGQFVPQEKPTGPVIKVLGRGCNNCRELTQRVMDVLSELKLSADLEHVTDIREIARYPVLGSPALVINGRVVSVGSVPGKKQIAEWLKSAEVQ